AKFVSKQLANGGLADPHGADKKHRRRHQSRANGSLKMRGVRKISSSTLSTVSLLFLNKRPRKGISPNIGTLLTLVDFSSSRIPPITIVCPLSTSTCVVNSVVSIGNACSLVEM